MKTQRFANLARAGSVAVITVDSPPVNALSAPVRAQLFTTIQRASEDPSLRAIVLICAGRTFFAGADIREFGKPPEEPTLPQLIDLIESRRKPVIAAIHGTALGGGFELALSCHYRVALSSARVGLPEVTLGLMPGAGGTLRLPRLIGVPAALDIIVTGRQVGAQEALTLGMLDAVFAKADLRTSAIAFAERVAEARPLPRARERTEHIEAARSRPEIFAEFRRANARRLRGFLAPEQCIRAVEAGVHQPFDVASKTEHAAFFELLSGEQAKAQIHVFFAQREAARVPGLPADAGAPPRTVGVIGAGTMGGGIAMNFLNAGIPVRIVEVDRAALERGVQIIRRNYADTAAKGKLTAAEVDQRTSLLSGTTEFDALSECDLVIEAVFEDMAVKKAVFRRLDECAKPGAVLASNTSFLDLDEIAAATRRPEQVIGLHFFSPANVMKLLEIVRGARTAPHVLAAALQAAKRIGKIPVVVGVCHGFVGNRMLEKRQQQALALVLEGAMPWDVDRVLYEFGMPMGPFAMADLAGLDIGWSRESSRGASLHELLCEAGRFGQKTRAGFYDYDAERKPHPSATVEKTILDFAAAGGIPRRRIGDDEILERCIYPMINEGAKILEDGIASRASDIDVVWLHGYGWPAWRGGPMFYADSLGAAKVVASLQEYAAKFGSAFTPANLLVNMAREKRRFFDE